MSSRGGPGQSRGAAVGPQPLKATVPYQLTSKARCNRRDGESAGKSKAHELSCSMRRTVSLDAIIGPYLQGHWPKELKAQGRLCRKDKATQTPDSWFDKSQSRPSSCSHKRSASWGSAEHIKEISKLKQQLQQRSKPGVSGSHDKDLHSGYPHGNSRLGTTPPIPIPFAPLTTLVPRLRCSVEGLNQELEGMFICQPSPAQHRLLEVPDGRRAPIPSQSCSSGSQSDLATTPPSSSSTSSSPCCSPTSVSTSPPEDMHQGLMESTDLCLLSPFNSQNEADLQLLISCSPGPNKSCCFQREPPEGCEKVRVWEETSPMHQPKPVAITSCPDPNKVNFTSHGGSAFCPVSLLKPLLPSMDLLFRSLSVSPANSLLDQGAVSCQATSSGNRFAAADPPASTVIGEGSGEGLVF